MIFLFFLLLNIKNYKYTIYKARFKIILKKQIIHISNIKHENIFNKNEKKISFFYNYFLEFSLSSSISFPSILSIKSEAS